LHSIVWSWEGRDLRESSRILPQHIIDAPFNGLNSLRAI
jgi:hypothetical protein